MNLMLNPRRMSALMIAVACGVLSTEHLAFGQKKFIIFGDQNVKYQTFRDASGRFQLEYPTKDWNSFPAGGSTVAILARNDRTATLVIDLARLSEPLAPSEIGPNAQIEVDSLKERHPQAKDFNAELLESPAGRASLIRYARMDANRPQRVLLYSISFARDLYRLDAVVQEGSLAKHEPVVLHMFQSFKVPADPVKPGK